MALMVLAILVTGSFGRLIDGVFFGIGLLMGLFNAILVRRSVAAITAGSHLLKRKMAINSAGRLLVFTVIALAIAFAFRPDGLCVVFGLAFFQVLLVVSTALPVWKKLRTPNASLATSDQGAGGDSAERRQAGDE